MEHIVTRFCGMIILLQKGGMFMADLSVVVGNVIGVILNVIGAFAVFAVGFGLGLKNAQKD